ncbi:Rqc2 family fibronectin-binding protein [Calderihabitans maritimus]|uniref:Rqc2 homolog RqcH n=1 Tax=Calderihabitans maritimus TaxID=1246530 RepID=A0A1Z5HWN2_9FIRM|nr:NFACT RNA binding domain-containing protein [Calderihabitans maritimus]GAW93943.1 fibronectin-binding A domain-containing protein [Calderihabitans maritimus]
MAYDGVVLAAVRQELNTTILQGRIERIYQPQKELVLFHIHQKGQTHKLLFSVQAASARVHLTRQNWENPPAPPSFCMLLRKHLEGGRVVKIEQPGLERILRLFIQNYNEMGELTEKVLIAEIMGKHSNLILLDPKTNNIIDGIKRYTFAVNRYREVFPGKPYLPPPPQEKLFPLEVAEETFREKLLYSPLSQKLNRILLQNFEGFSPQTCTEIVFRAGLEADTVLDQCGEYEITRLWQAFKEVVENIREGRFCPTLIKLDETYQAFSVLDLTQYPETSHLHPSTISSALDLFYTAKQLQERIKQQRSSLIQLVEREINRLSKKLSHQMQILSEAEKAEKYRMAGDLVTANIYRLRKGDKILRAENFYHPEAEEVIIELNPELTPAQNAQFYYKKYNKLKRSSQRAREEIEPLRNEIYYLESVLHSLENADDEEHLEEIRGELVATGYLKKQPSPKKEKEKTPAPNAPLSFLSSDGLEILVGKNNRQNDFLTFKLAGGNDMWLHVKDYPGSHVIIKTPFTQNIPSRTLEEAAQLAAFYSKARHAPKVAVDYTQRKNVRKPKGAKPGMVLYEAYKTILVTPAKAVSEKTKNG